MGVYVDKRPARYGERSYHHMVSDTLTELHKTASDLGISKERFCKSNVPHYKILRIQKNRAVEYGVEVLSRSEMDKLLASIKSKKSKATRKTSKPKKIRTDKTPRKSRRTARRRTQAKKTLELGEWVNRAAMWITISLICEFQNHWVKVIVVGFIEHWRKHYGG